MPDVRIGGAEEFRRLARELKRADLGDALTRGIERGVRPAVDAAKREPLRRLPRRGGLGRTVAGTKLTVRTRTSGRGSGVQVKALPNAVKDPASIDRGRIRRPTFGHRPWQIQLVRPGWFSDPMRASAGEVRRGIERELSVEVRKVRR